MLKRLFILPKEVVKHVLGLVVPMIWSRFVQMFGWFFGMLMIAHLGQDALAASALINAAQTMVCVLFMSLFFSVSVVAGRLYGEKKHDELGALLQQALIFGIVIGVFVAIVFYYLDVFLRLTGQPPAVVAITGDYFRVLAWWAIPFMILVNLQQFCYGILQQRLVVINNIICVLVLIPTAYLFIFGGLGIPALGVRGLALAVILQGVVCVIFLAISLYHLPDFKHYRLFARRENERFHYVKKVFQIGWPMSIQFGGELLAFFVMTLLTGWLGISALSAAQITTQLMLLFLVPLFAVAEAAGILISQAVGSKRLDLVGQTAHVCILLGMFIVFILSIFFFSMPNQLSALYIDIHNPAEAKTLVLARWLFYLAALSLCADTLRNLYTGALRGFYDTQFPMWIGLLSLWIIALPLSYVMGFSWGWGVIGIRLAVTLGLFLGAIILGRRWQRKVRTLGVEL